MKLFKITFLIIVCLYFIIEYSYVNASYSISIERSEYIKAQLDRRSDAVVKEMNKMADNINTVFSSNFGGLFFGLSTISNSLSGLFGILNFAIPCGGAALFSSAVLGVTQNYIQNAHAGDIGYTITQGVNALIKQQISDYNTQQLAARISEIRTLQNGFYNNGTSYGYLFTINKANDLKFKYNAERSYFELQSYQLDSIGLYTLYANAHLLFLYDMVVSGPKYNFTQSDINNFHNEFINAVTYYRNYIDNVDIKGREELENVGVSDKRNQDEWNMRNDYYNYIKLFVYDISNYWDYLDPFNFPTGIFIENAHVSLSNLFGAPYNGDNHFSNSDIDNFLNNKNVYQYQGKLTGIWYKSFPCGLFNTALNINLVKYFGGKQFFFRDGVEKNTFYLGDEGSTYPLQYLGVNSLKSFEQFNSRDKSPESSSKDYFWGLNASNTAIGDVVSYKTKELIQYPQKVVALALPLSYNECNVPCYDHTSVLLVESAVMGFVNEDVSNDNIVFELTSSMIDAQKYNYIYPPTGFSYSKDGYQRYKHSMYIPANSLVTYKIEYNPYNKLPGTFKLYIDFKPAGTQSTVVDIHYSRADYECVHLVISKDISGSGIKELGDITLNPSSLTDNYVTVQFSNAVYFQHLTFKAIE